MKGFELLEQNFVPWSDIDERKINNGNLTDQYIFIMRKLIRKITSDQRVGNSVIIQNDN